MTIYNGDCLEVLRGLPDDSVDSVCTDPPYGLSKEPVISEVLTKWLAGEAYDHGHGGFMGKSWDSFVPHPDVWREVYRVLKPGGYALVFAGTRTQDLMTIALRLAGFEVRDVIEWLYFSGFPKSMDVGKAFDKRDGAEREVIGSKIGQPGYSLRANDTEAHSRKAYGQYTDAEKECAITAPATPLARQWDGWGTALKPAHEPIIVVRKPLIGTVADNVERYGTGGINIDGCRIAEEGYAEKALRKYSGVINTEDSVGHGFMTSNCGGIGCQRPEALEKGRFPANAITTDDDAFYSPYFNVSPAEVSKKAGKKDRNADWTGAEIELEPKEAGTHNNVGRDMTNPKNAMGEGERKRIERGEPAQEPAKNNHPTVKPTDLMAWLIRLVTPPGGTVLDPFAGSGTTLVAAKREGFDFIGIEREAEYVEIIEARTKEPVSV